MQKLIFVIVGVAVLSIFCGVSQADDSIREPLFRIEPQKGFNLRLHFLPYEGQAAAVRLPESVYAKFAEPDKMQIVELDWNRPAGEPFVLQDDGWWVQSENAASSGYIVRIKPNDSGERIDIECTISNKTQEAWEYGWIRNCIAPPKDFQDSGLKRTWVVDRHGTFRPLSELLDYDFNFISIEGQQSTAACLPPTKWDAKWRYPDLRLAETVVMTEAKDGRYTLVTAFEKAYGIETGFCGPCIHSDGRTGEIAAGGQGMTRGFMALVEGDAHAGYKYFQNWKKNVGSDKPKTVELSKSQSDFNDITHASFFNDLKFIASSNNPDPRQLPTIIVNETPLGQTKQALVSLKFPNIPDFICDAWCYESLWLGIEFMDARPLENGKIELRHQSREFHFFLITEITPHLGAVEFSARIEKNGDVILPKLHHLSICWQFIPAKNFCSRPESYMEFVKRCFIFTETGRTFLDQTDRQKSPSIPVNDTRNNPPWVQQYLSVGQEVPQIPGLDWSGISNTRYTAPVIGLISKDGKYLAAVAGSEPLLMLQAWHDCVHNLVQLVPSDEKIENRRWVNKLYVMENDADILMEKVQTDFPLENPTLSRP